MLDRMLCRDDFMECHDFWAVQKLERRMSGVDRCHDGVAMGGLW